MVTFQRGSTCRRSPRGILEADEPAVIELYRDLGEAIDWDLDDPRLPGLVDRLVASIDDVADAEWEAYEEDFELADDLVDLLDSVFLDSGPIAPRLLELLEERGWTGWTRFERVDPSPP